MTKEQLEVLDSFSEPQKKFILDYIEENLLKLKTISISECPPEKMEVLAKARQEAIIIVRCLVDIFSPEEEKTRIRNQYK